MRTREEIELELATWKTLSDNNFLEKNPTWKMTFELLLDIRDLLASK